MDRWQLTREGDVFTLRVNNGENKIGTIALSEWNRALDAVIKTGSDKVLIITGTDHYWSTGLDLDEVNRMSHLERQAFMARIDALLAKILTAPFVTIAALNGHTYAGGALLALAHDYRIMRSDRGYFCLPSIDVGIPAFSGIRSRNSSGITPITRLGAPFRTIFWPITSGSEPNLRFQRP